MKNSWFAINIAVIMLIVVGMFLASLIGFYFGKEFGYDKGYKSGLIEGHYDVTSELAMEYFNCGVIVEDKRCPILYEAYVELRQKHEGELEQIK